MRPRHPLPRIWLVTDERQGERLAVALRRLPRGAGILLRHYSLDDSQRRALLRRISGPARARRQMVLLAGPAAQARAWGANGSHGCEPGAGFRSAPVHNLSEIRAAERAGAALLFLSPLFPTRSHPGAPALGTLRFAALARATRLPVVALGGMDGGRGARAQRLGAYGWAAVDAWTR